MNDARNHCFAAIAFSILVGVTVPGSTAAGGPVTEPAVERTIPDARGLPAVFAEAQTVTVPVPPEPAKRWRVLDDGGVQVRSGRVDPSTPTVEVGSLGIGWYRIEFLSQDDECAAWTTVAVLARPSAPVPQDSPVCIDSATAWFAPNDPAKQERFARLAALAGVNWIRDRMRWRDIEPEPGRFVDATTTYDTSADLQAKHGLKVLQVFHGTPEWAVEDGELRGRYPADLRHAYRFCREMARRYKGRVQAWEPWNEANVADFGGHTADEMCTYQKAAYLGFKAGDPELIVCWNVSTAVPTMLHTRLVLANETWPYFDTYNTHTYDWPDSYERLWGPVHEAACGRPIWVTESDRGLQCVGPEPWCELSREGERQKAEFMAQSYASSLFAGAERHFHFILGNYYERSKVQFGLLRLDQTPRPSYVALAAVGRFLAGGECLGRWSIPPRSEAHVYAFAARPDGKDRDVLVAWAEKPGDWPQRGKTTVEWALPKAISVAGVYDYLGRHLGSKVPERLTSAPVFVVLRPGDASELPLEPPVQRSEYRSDEACPVVLQLHMPRSTSVNVQQIPWASDYEHQVEPETQTVLPFYAYNFSDKTVRGRIAIDHAPEGWTFEPNAWTVSLDPMDRAELPCRFLMPARNADKTSNCWVRLRGDFGKAGRPVLVFRLIAKPGEGYDAPPP